MANPILTKEFYAAAGLLGFLVCAFPDLFGMEDDRSFHHAQQSSNLDTSTDKCVADIKAHIISRAQPDLEKIDTPVPSANWKKDTWGEAAIREACTRGLAEAKKRGGTPLIVDIKLTQ